MSWTNILTHNLTTGAACCAAFHDGIDESQQHDLYHRHGYRTHQCWSPGCGKPSVEEDEEPLTPESLRQAISLAAKIARLEFTQEDLAWLLNVLRTPVDN